MTETASPPTDEMNPSDLKRYTYRGLNIQAKRTFKRIQLKKPDGGSEQDYRYKGWDILIVNGSILQVLNYDVITLEIRLKRSSVIVL